MQENLTPLNVSLVLSRACRKLCLTKKTCSPIFEKQFPPPFHIYQHPRIFFSCNPIVVVGVMLFMQFIYILRYFSTTFSFFISSLFSYLVRERKLIINGTIFFSITFFKIKRMFSLPLVIDLLLMTVCPFIIRGWQTISTFFFLLPHRLRRTPSWFFFHLLFWPLPLSLIYRRNINRRKCLMYDCFHGNGPLEVCFSVCACLAFNDTARWIYFSLPTKQNKKKKYKGL